MTKPFFMLCAFSFLLVEFGPIPNADGAETRKYNRNVLGQVEISALQGPVPVYGNSALGAATVGKLSDGDIVSVFQTTDRYGEEWFEVEYADGKSGWIACAAKTYTAEWVWKTPAPFSSLKKAERSNEFENNRLARGKSSVSGQQRDLGIWDLPAMVIAIPFAVLHTGLELIGSVLKSVAGISGSAWAPAGPPASSQTEPVRQAEEFKQLAIPYASARPAPPPLLEKR